MNDNDDNKNNPDIPEDNQAFENFEESFEDDFGLEDMQEPNVAPSAPSPQETVQRPPTKSHSILPTLIGIAALGFLGWKLYDTFFHKDAVSSSSLPPVSTALPPEIPPEVVHAPQIIDTPIPPPPAPISSLPAPEEISQSDIKKLQLQITAQEKSYQQKIAALEKDIALAKENAAYDAQKLTQLQRDMGAFSTVIQELGKQIDSLRENQERDMLRKTRPTSKAAAKKEAAASGASSSTLAVYAIIPGRAWLRSTNGKTITVTEGESLGEYGRVLKIDAGNGVVITTSGTVLR